MARGSVRRRECTHRHPKDHPRTGEKVENCRRAHGWWYVIDAGLNPDTGKRKQVTKSGFKTKADAEEAMRKELARIDGGVWADDKRITVRDFLTLWLEECKPRTAPKTYQSYESHVNGTFIPALGHLRLRDLRRGHVEAALAELAKPRTGGRPKGNAGRFVEQRTGKTVDWYRRTLRSALAAAVRKELIMVNPAEGRIDAIPKTRPAKHTIWSTDQAAGFLRSTADTDLGPLWIVAAFCGGRRGELLGARWSDLDPDEGGGWIGLNVRQTLSSLSGAHECSVCGGTHTGRLIKATKTEAGDRWVPIVPAVSDALLRQQARQAEHRELFGPDYADHDLVFALPDGNPVRPSDITKAFRDETDRLELPRIRLHDLRGGATSIYLAGGVPIELVSMVLGHADTKTTRRHYAQLMRHETRDLLSQATIGLNGEQSVSNRRPESIDSGRSEG